jgi:hypothetical protein
MASEECHKMSADLDQFATNPSSDCGCGGKSGNLGIGADPGNIGEIPSIDEIEKALAEVMQEGTGNELDLELATVDQDLSAEERFGFSAFESQELPTLGI